MRGGHGKAGRKKHKWTYVLKHEPNYFGKHGFQRAWVPQSKTMNVGDLDEQVERFLDTGVAEKVENSVTINLTDLGVDKLLGSGKVTRPLVVYVQSWSKAAAQKIEGAGGQLLASADVAVAETDEEA